MRSFSYCTMSEYIYVYVYTRIHNIHMERNRWVRVIALFWHGEMSFRIYRDKWASTSGPDPTATAHMTAPCIHTHEMRTWSIKQQQWRGRDQSSSSSDVDVINQAAAVTWTWSSRYKICKTIYTTNNIYLCMYLRLYMYHECSERNIFTDFTSRALHTSS